MWVQPIGVHGRNLTSRTGKRTAETPFPRDDQPIEQRIVYLSKPVTVRQSIEAAQRSMVKFLTTGFAGAATIDVTGLETWFDFDDDGWSDDEERAGGTSPFDPASHPSGEPPHSRPL